MEINLEGLEYRLSIPGYQISGGFEAKCIMNDGIGADWARIRMTDELTQFLKDKDTGDCILEYGGEPVLQGPGTYFENADQILIIKSDKPGLATVQVSATFLDCSIQEAARYILAASGIEEYVLTNIDFGRKKMFSIYAKSCEEALRELNTVFGADIDFFSVGGIFYYGVAPEQDGYYTLTDDNVMYIEKSGDIWWAEIIPLPSIRPRCRINFSCEEFIGIGVVTECVIDGGESGIDMYIRFKEA